MNDEESIRLCVVDIISKYSSYNSLRAYNANENSEIDIPCVDKIIYELRQTRKVIHVWLYEITF